MKFSAETTKKIAERDATRARMVELQLEATTLEATIEDTGVQLNLAAKLTAAEAYRLGKHVEIAKLRETREQAKARLIVIRDAVQLQRGHVERADFAAARAASTDLLPEYRKACGEAALSIVALLVAVEHAAVVSDSLTDPSLKTESVLETIGPTGLGNLRDSSARWTYLLKELMRFAGVTTGELAQAFGPNLWPIARKSLGIDDASPITKASRAFAAAIGA